jgi:hypothetical protein
MIDKKDKIILSFIVGYFVLFLIAIILLILSHICFPGAVKLFNTIIAVMFIPLYIMFIVGMTAG